MKSFEGGGSGGVYNTDAYWRMLSDLSGTQGSWMKSPEKQVEPEAETVKGLGAEAMERIVEENSDVETPEPGEVEAEVEQAREELSAWSEKLAGTPEEYWQQLEKDWWVQSGVPMEYYAQPKFEVLLEKAKEFLKAQAPELSEAGLEARAELATKVALQSLAEREMEMLQGAKLDRKGERKLKKGWDGDLLHQAYYAMRGDLAQIYAQDETMELGDDLSERELAAWWVASEPENAKAKQALERLQAVEPVEPVEPEAEEAEEEIGHLRDDETEVVYEPKPIATMDDIVAKSKQAEKTPEGMVQKLWQMLRNRAPFVEWREQAVTALAPVAPEGGIVEVVEPPAEEVDSKEAVGQTIGMVQQAIQALERDVSYLEDYDEKKSSLLRMLNELLILCVNIQVEYEAAADDIEDGKRQKALGLELDKIEVGESDALREGELALEGLYADGTLEREQPTEAKVEHLRELEAQVEAQMRACNELLKKILPAVRYLNYELKNEATEVEGEDRVVEFPSAQALQELKG